MKESPISPALFASGNTLKTNVRTNVNEEICQYLMILDISFNQGFFKHIVLGQYTQMDRAAGFAYVILLQNREVLVH